VDKAIKTAGNIGESCFEMILFRMTDFEIKARQKTPREREGSLQAELDSDAGVRLTLPTRKGLTRLTA